MWSEFAPALALLPYAVFRFNDFSGTINGVDWQAVDILLKHEKITTDPQAFADFRVILNGFIAAENEHSENTKPV